ncbi:MAG: thioredoxin domain-containing protein [Alphaproteobacteria bacterium]|nr:thioredoxin domain-containing protein [Alphaproteobacteria bacterium]
MKLVIGVIASVCLAVVLFGAWLVKDIKDNQLQIGAGEAIAAEPEKVNSPEIQGLIKERYVGNAEAPVSVYVFSSFTCSHCAVFHEKIFPELKKRYADSGKIALYFSDFPLEVRAAAASMIAHCMPEKSYWQFVDTVFSTQGKWALSPNYGNILTSYASLGGLSADKAKECMENKALLKALLAKRDADSTKYSIHGTPTVVVVSPAGMEQVEFGAGGAKLFSHLDSLLKKGEKK